MIDLKFDTDKSGNKVLSGQLFENIEFFHLEINAPSGNFVQVENCRFLDCSTSPGTCVIGDNVTLKNVVFSNLDCGDAIHISSETELNEVIIRGG